MPGEKLIPREGKLALLNFTVENETHFVHQETLNVGSVLANFNVLPASEIVSPPQKNPLFSVVLETSG